MLAPLIIQTINGFFWNGMYWDTSAHRAKLFQSRSEAFSELECHGETEESWLIRPAALYPEIDLHPKNESGNNKSIKED